LRVVHFHVQFAEKQSQHFHPSVLHGNRTFWILFPRSKVFVELAYFLHDRDVIGHKTVQNEDFFRGLIMPKTHFEHISRRFEGVAIQRVQNELALRADRIDPHEEIATRIRSAFLSVGIKLEQWKMVHYEISLPHIPPPPPPIHTQNKKS
jgi:hypothetical protein